MTNEEKAFELALINIAVQGAINEAVLAAKVNELETLLAKREVQIVDLAIQLHKGADAKHTQDTGTIRAPSEEVHGVFNEVIAL